uniref:Uncharacterized protein n=1 Tax=Rodentolepis nana TaxID=102285 RepID=A0A0R3TGN7_RODNA
MKTLTLSNRLCHNPVSLTKHETTPRSLRPPAPAVSTERLLRAFMRPSKPAERDDVPRGNMILSGWISR